MSSSLSREHSKGIFNLFRRKPKPDSSHPSPEDQFLESPTSPETHPNGPYPPYLKPTLNSSDVSVGDHPTTMHTSDPERAGRTKRTSKGKRWIFATMDSWNYRLIDVSEMETVESLRAGICQGLGISDWANAQIFVTEPGQTEHEEPVNDANLVLCRRNRSDPDGSLKLFVRGTVTQSAQPTPRFDGLGVSIPDKHATSPTTLYHQLHRKPLDEDALNRLSPNTPGKPLGSPSQATFNTSPAANGSQDQSADSEKDIRARYEEHLREVERKQKEYRNSRLHPSQQPLKDNPGDTGIRGTKVIDFDKGRISPYEKDTFSKTDTLMPLRKAPSAPNESNTLTKVNSLSKRPGDRDRARPPQAVHTHGLGAAITGMGRIGGAIGTPSPSVPVPPSPSNRDSATSESATLDSAVTSTSSQTTPSKCASLFSCTGN
jgi:mitogen-activated protein kinase kinase kinase